MKKDENKNGHVKAVNKRNKKTITTTKQNTSVAEYEQGGGKEIHIKS